MLTSTEKAIAVLAVITLIYFGAQVIRWVA